jgi:hypothetical protein
MTYVLNVWIDDEEVTRWTDMDSALNEMAQRPTELSETIERTETGTIIHTPDEMGLMLEEMLSEIAADKRAA